MPAPYEETAREIVREFMESDCAAIDGHLTPRIAHALQAAERAGAEKQRDAAISDGIRVVGEAEAKVFAAEAEAQRLRSALEEIYDIRFSSNPNDYMRSTDIARTALEGEYRAVESNSVKVHRPGLGDITTSPGGGGGCLLLIVAPLLWLLA